MIPFSFSMTDAKANGHRRGPSSFIPIAMPLIQPRTSLHHLNSNAHKSSSIPDSNSAPLLSSQSRSFSVGHYPSPQTSPNSKSTFAPSDPTASQPQLQQQSTPVSSGKTTFRSFRNLLPFGPGKSPASSNTAGSPSVLTPKRSFSLGQRPGKEKDKGGDKKSRSPIPTLSDLPDPCYPPVLVIQNAHSPSELGEKVPPRTSGLLLLPPQLPPLRLQSETKRSAPLISATLPLPASTSNPLPIPASPLRIHHSMFPCPSF